MPIANASLSSIRDVEEVTYGVPPATTYQERRLVNETLGHDKEVTQSEEIVPDRRSPGNIQVGASGSGDMVSELTGGSGSFQTWDTHWRAALGATGYTTTVGYALGALSGTITPSNLADPDDIQLLLSVGNFPAFASGEFVQFTGFTGVRAVLNTIFKVKSGGGTNTLVLTASVRVPASPGTENSAVTSAFTLRSVTDGSVFRSFSMERLYGGLSDPNRFSILSGFVLQGFTVELQPKRPMRVTWRWLGRTEETAAAQVSSGVTAAATTVQAFSPVTDFAQFSLDEDGHSFFLNSFRLDFRNGAYLQDEQAGTVGAVGVGLGTFEVTGSYEFYYTGPSVNDQLAAFTNKDLMFSVRNANARAWGVHLPVINWTGGRRSLAGKDQAVKGRVDFRAARGPAFMIKIAVI